MAEVIVTPEKRVVLVYWKQKKENQFEVFSNLKNFCLSYKNFSYNTLNNYLSKAKIAYDNEDVRVERMKVILRPKLSKGEDWKRQISPMVRKVKLIEADDEVRDQAFWLTKTPSERMLAVKRLNDQFYPKQNGIEKNKIVKRKMRP